MNNSFIYSKYFDIIFFHWLKASGDDQLWEMGAIFLWFRYIYIYICWLRNEVYQWYIWLECRLRGQCTIDQPHFQAWPPSCTVYSRLKFKKWKIAEFLTKMEQKKCKNKQNIVWSMNVLYTMYWRNICKKKSLFCLYPESVQRKRSKFRWNSYGGKLVKKLKI